MHSPVAGAQFGESTRVAASLRRPAHRAGICHGAAAPAAPAHQAAGALRDSGQPAALVGARRYVRDRPAQLTARRTAPYRPVPCGREVTSGGRSRTGS
jgi:hypothetical protein